MAARPAPRAIFTPGGDHRNRNTLNPGPNGSFNVQPANGTLTAANFPLTRTNPFSDKDDRVGSQGVHNRIFVDIVPGNPVDNCTASPDAVFNSGGQNVRRVTGRNTPTAVTSNFNLRNFWDGRAYHRFNGRSPIGPFDTGAQILENNSGLSLVTVSIELSSTSSQAAGPPNNDVEMSCSGRIWPKLGKKMLSLTPLGLQKVAFTDSVLGPLANSTSTTLNPGLNTSYSTLIQTAFNAKYWNSTKKVDGAGTVIGDLPTSGTNEFSQMEFNFSLFWGMAIQAYETTLRADNSLFDRAQQGLAKLSAVQKQGLNVFLKNECGSCHEGSLFSIATTPELLVDSSTPIQLIDNFKSRADNVVRLTDVGFFNIGVRPTAEELIEGNTVPFDPLSFTRMYKSGNATLINNIGFPIDPCLFQENPCVIPNPSSPDSVNGSAKVPTLRNLEFTGPYFHNGGKKSLAEVVTFYNQGGDFPGNVELHRRIGAMGLKAADQAALVQFLLTLSDLNLRFEKAPFDHPQLCVANGAQTPIGAGTFGAADNLKEIPAVGAAGNTNPLQTFEELLNGTNSGRTHNMQAACNHVFGTLTRAVAGRSTSRQLRQLREQELAQLAVVRM